MNWNNFKHMFHSSWHKSLKPFIESKECDKIYEFLKSESKRGKKIAPLSINTYRAFYHTPLDELKCVIIGREPYAKFEDEAPIADGILFGGSIQYPLDGFYRGIEKELHNGLNLNYIKYFDLSYLCQQGVLMVSASLTVEKDIPGSHSTIWEPFISYLLNKIIAPSGVPVIIMGENLFKYKELLNNNEVFCLDYPNIVKWDTRGTFKKVSDIIWNKEKDTISWLYEPPF